MWPLRFAHLPFKAHNLHPVFAQRAVHVGAPLDTLVRPLQEKIGDVWVDSHVMGREYLDRSVHDVRDLREEFQLPVLGEVARIQPV